MCQDPKTMSDLGDELCKYCPLDNPNTGPHNLCEGRSCDEAYDAYLEELDICKAAKAAVDYVNQIT